MASDDRNEQVTNLEIVDSLTDPGGTEHTGSLGGDTSARTDEEIRDVVVALLAAGADISLSHDDPNNELAIDFAGTNYTAERAQDDVAAALSGSTDIDVSYDDAANTITIAYTGAGGIDVEDTDGSAVVADAAAITAGSGLDFTDDGDGTATLDYTGDGGGGGGAGSVEESGSVTLSSGSATVQTGVNSGTIDVSLDPSNFGNAGTDVSVRAVPRWDSSAGTYAIDFIEDQTSVGDPTVAYTVLQYPSPGEATVVLEDFEDQTLSGYSGTPTEFSINTSNPLRGNASLENTGSDYIAHDTITTGQGYRYEAHLQAASSDQWHGPRFCTHMQGTDGQNSVQLWLEPYDNALKLRVKDGGANAESWNAGSGTVDAGTTYVAFIEYPEGSDEATFGYEDTDGTVIDTATATVTTYTSGALGWGTEAGGGTGHLMDHARRIPL